MGVVEGADEASVNNFVAASVAALTVSPGPLYDALIAHVHQFAYPPVGPEVSAAGTMTHRF